MPGPGAFAELLAHPGVEELLELRSPFGFLAFHGGSLEQITDEVAAAAAERAGASLYAVRQPEGFQWHLPSVLVDPEQSAHLAAFLDHVEVAVSVHGYGRRDLFQTLLVGGGNRALATQLSARLRAALPDYDVVDDLDRIPAELRGLHRANPVNRCRGGGVQLELPPRVRTWTPHWADLPPGAPIPHLADLVAGLVTAARSWPLAVTG